MAFTATALLGTFVGAGGASSATTGFGSATTLASLVDATVGGTVLRTGLLDQDSVSTIDPNVGDPEAVFAVDPLVLESTAADLSGIDDLVPDEYEVSAGDGESQVAPTTEIDLANPHEGVDLAPVISGTIRQGEIRAVVDTSGAHTELDVSAADLGLAGGALLSVDEISGAVATDALTDQSRSTRRVSVGEIRVLDLDELLSGFGISLSDLSLDRAGSLLSTLGLSVPLEGTGLDPDGLSAVDGADALGTLVTDVNEAVDAVQALEDAILGLTLPCVDLGVLLTDELDAATAALGDLGVSTDITCSTDLDALVDDLQSRLAGVLEDVLAVLDGVPLLTLEGVEVSLTALARETVEASSADVTATIGAAKVGDLPVVGVDAVTLAHDLGAAEAAVMGALGGILDDVHAVLSNVVSVDFLTEETSVAEDQGYVRSRAALAAAAISISVPDGLDAAIAAIEGETGIGDEITQRGGRVPASGVDMTALADQLGLATAAAAGPSGPLAAGPSSVQVLSLEQTADFITEDVSLGLGYEPRSKNARGAAPPLPRTGIPGDALLAAGLVLAGGGLALRRLSSRLPGGVTRRAG